MGTKTLLALIIAGVAACAQEPATIVSDGSQKVKIKKIEV